MLFLKISLLILVLILGILPSFFKIINESNSYKSIFGKLTGFGWLLLSIFLVVGIITIIVEINNDKESTANKNDLTVARNDLIQIKEAIEKSGFRYDSSNKMLINNNYVANQNGAINLSNMYQPTIKNVSAIVVDRGAEVPLALSKNPNFRKFNEQQLNELFINIDKAQRELKTNRIYIFVIDKQKQEDVLNQLTDVLVRKGLIIEGNGVWNPEAPKNNHTTYIENFNGKIGLYIPFF
jgi:hypothetical protein